MSNLTLPQDTSITALVEDLNRQLVDLWWRCDTHLPSLEPTYTARQQTANEAQLARLIDVLTAEVKRPPLNVSERSQARDRITAHLSAFAKSALSFDDRHLQAIQSWGFIEAAGAFVQMARQFDPSMSGEDIFQAARNVMSMNFMQLLMGLPVEVTPAVFAYSMLYPYTDNYLDDLSIGQETKHAFNERFARRLAGENIAPANAHEQTIYNLVGLIEDQFDRSHYPQVFESLLAIHTAQAKSLALHSKNASPYEIDILGLSFEKGGTSVLADGYLVAGSLSRPQAEFMYSYGAFTQLMDDLEDVQQDMKSGIMTVFSQTAQHWTLDAVTNRLFHLGHEIFSSERMASFEGTVAESLKEFMGICLDPLLVDSVGRANRLYSSSYLRQLEPHLPFRFQAVGKQRKKLARHIPSIMRLAEMITIPTNTATYRLSQTEYQGMTPVAGHAVS